MITTIKRCFKCGAEKPLSDFYKHSQMADGHLNKCKGCTKKDVNKNREDNLDYYREYDRQRGSRQSPEYLKEYPNKYKAHCLVNNAVRDKKLIPACVCDSCKSTENIVAHHADYLKPLEVQWLCQGCHIQWHKLNGEGMNGGDEVGL